MDQYIDVNGQDITDTTVTQRGRYGKNTSLRTCDIYDPNAGTWAVGPQLVEGRARPLGASRKLQQECPALAELARIKGNDGSHRVHPHS